MIKHCRFVRISICLLGLMLVFIPTGITLATGGHSGLEMEAGGYRFKLVFEGPLKTGPNEIGIKITDLSGNPAPGASVEVYPVQISSEDAAGEADPHGEAEGGHAEAQVEVHDETDGEIEGGHSDSSVMAEHGEAESHTDMEADDHEPAGGHAESRSVVLKASQEAGLYSGKISFTEPGEWTLLVRVVMTGETEEEELNFPVEVIAAGPPWGILSGFFGINLTVIAAAGFLKRKPAAAKS